MTHKYLQPKNITASNALSAEIAAALNGDYRKEHLFVLQQELQLYDFYQTQMTECDLRIEECLTQFNDKVDV